jgi:hypothetical protein
MIIFFYISRRMIMTFRNLKWLITLALICFIGLISSCAAAVSGSSSLSADKTTADLVAESTVNPQTGIVGDISEQFRVASGGTVNLKSMDDISGQIITKYIITSDSNGRISLFDTNGITIMASGSDSGGVFYYRSFPYFTFTNDVFELVQSNFMVTNRFYTSLDGTGLSTNYSGKIDFLTNMLHAVHHTRSLELFFTNMINGNVRHRTINADFMLTNIMVNSSTSNSTAILLGTRIETLSVSNSNRQGNWTFTNYLDNLELSRQMLSPGVYFTGITGNIEYTVNGTWTNFAGKIKTIQESNTIVFNGTRYVTVHSGGASVVFDMLTN